MMSESLIITRNIAVVIFLMAMTAAAELFGQHEIIFPEAGALCIGLWLMPKAVWNIRSWQIPIFLTAASIVGLVINLIVPACFEIRFLLAFVVVIVLLRLVRCNMYPIVSAAMLPVLIGTTSWVYPLSVFAISIILLAGRIQFSQKERNDYYPFSPVQMLALTIALCVPLIITLNSTLSTLHFLMVPPLVVTMIEFANRKSGFRERPFTIWLLIIAAAVISTGIEFVLHRTLGIFMAVGTLLTAILMLLLFHRYKPFAPAMAIALVPMILPDTSLLWFPLLATIGSGWFIFMGMIMGKNYKPMDKKV